ncbi:MAG: hypothetical protein AAF602_09980 [Myxococcota bacterium]
MSIVDYRGAWLLVRGKAERRALPDDPLTVQGTGFWSGWGIVD